MEIVDLVNRLLPGSQVLGDSPYSNLPDAKYLKNAKTQLHL